MLFLKKCNKCQAEMSVERNIKDCPQCGNIGSLERIFKTSVEVNTKVKEDKFMQIDRMMLESKTPKGKTKTYI